MTASKLSRAALACCLLLAGAAAQAQQWKPTRPITLIVPWGAGGSTDQVARVTATEIEKALGQSVVVVNMPGAAGSMGTKKAWDAPRDGYTWVAGAAQDVGSYQAMGSLDASIADWHLFLNVANVQVIGVNAERPWKTVKELVDEMKARPGQVRASTAGQTSGGHTALGLIGKATGTTAKEVFYDGGNPAAVAAATGEADFTTQLAVEQADLIRAKRLRPLATVGDKPLEIEGYGTIPPLSSAVPGFKAPANHFGIFLPKGVPDEVVKTMERIWSQNISKSEALRKYAANRGALFAPQYGAEAQRMVMPAVRMNVWMLSDAGKTKVSPAALGIAKP